MAGGSGTFLVCSCEDSMTLEPGVIRRGCGRTGLVTGRQFCRAELDRFRALAQTPGELVVGCTQEAPLFEEVAEEMGFAHRVRFANLREAAGWSSEGAAAGPKMAALLAAAAVQLPPVAMVASKSQGIALIYGRDEVAIEAALQLADRLDITVLMDGAAEVQPPTVAEFPVLRGHVRAARGALGAFELTVDGFATPHPSSRASLRYGPPRNGAISSCDLVLDLTGAAPLFPAADLRPGYLRADPRDRLAVQRAIFAAAGLVGEFEKPRYVTYRASLCAHSRSNITGCTRCLEVCPTGAITPAGDHVAIDDAICAGCGSCHAVCPTGAATYALPPPDALLARVRALLEAYHAAGGVTPVLLLHDSAQGWPLIDMLARHGQGLPAHVLPLQLNETTQLGLEGIVAAFAYGAAGVHVLVRSRPRHDISALQRTLELATAIIAGLGLDSRACGLIAADDPDALATALIERPPATPVERPASFLPLGDKRSLTRLALAELHAAAPIRPETVPLPAGGPFGRVEVDVAGCTLCLACVAACPTKALSDDPERPTLRFTEALCVQCGLCARTCPERVIELEPRYDFRPSAASAVTLKAEEPFACIVCAKPFGTKSTIERIVGKLEGRHWMFDGEARRRVDLLRMCDLCRITAVTNSGFDPHAASPRPRPRTSDDYLRERDPLVTGIDGKE